MRWHIGILIILSAFSHFIFFGRPAEVVFDEVHFGRYSAAYSTGKYIFDVHPPLGKQLISLAGKLGGFDAASVDYDAIGNGYPDSSYIYYRILPMLAGFLLPIVIYLLCISLKISPRAAFFAGLAVIFENSLLVQSRFAFLDTFLIIFGFTSLLFYFRSRNFNDRSKVLYLILATFFAALTFCIKWTGLSFLGLILIVESWDFIVKLFHDHDRVRVFRNFFSRIFAFLVVGIIVYVSIFYIHFSLLTKSGPGDPFMSLEFQKTLSGSVVEKDQNIKPLNFPQKFIELNEEMYTSNKSLTAAHQYSSKWYSWPVMWKPIYYWNSTSTPVNDFGAINNHGLGLQSRIYLIGNPFIYWLGALAVFILATFILYSFFINKLHANSQRRGTASILLIGFLINWLPFILIGRVMFLYHYLSALIFSIIIMAFLVDLISGDRSKKEFIFGLTLIFLAVFLFFSPLTYGLPQSDYSYEMRAWFENWK